MLRKKIDRIPPFLCIAIATQVHGIPVEEVADKAHVSRRTVTRLNNMLSWESVKVGLVDRIADACQVDLLKPNLALDLLRASQGEDLFHGLPAKQRKKVFAMFAELKEKRQA